MRNQFVDGMIVIGVGLVFMVVMAGAGLGVGYLLKEDKKSKTYFRSAEESPPEPIEWSADRADGEPYMYFGSRERAEDFACSAEGAGWVYSADAGWAQVDCVVIKKATKPK